MKLNLPLTSFFMFAGLSASAQTSATTPFVDPHPVQSQTFIRQMDGTVATIGSQTEDWKVYTPGKVDPTLYAKTAVIRDKRMLPLAVTAMGANYAFFKGGYMATVSADGTFIFKNKPGLEPGVVGGNFFVDKNSGFLVTIDSYGYFSNCLYVPEEIRLAGGNWFVTKSNQLHTVRSVGNNDPTQAPYSTCIGMEGSIGAARPEATWAGGNFFVNMDGSIVGIDSVTGAPSVNQVPESAAGPLGGNYFISVDNYIYTIDNRGVLYKTIQIQTRPIYMGYSFMRWADGSFVIVTANGGVHQEAVRLNTSGKAEYTTKVPAMIDVNATFVPVQPRTQN